MAVCSIPKATLGRIPLYIQYLKKLPEENGEMISPEILVDETNKKTEEMNTRLNNLFKRKKQGS